MRSYRCAKCDYGVATDEKQPRCPTCILKFGEQKGRHVVLYQTDIPVLTSDFLYPEGEPCIECGAPTKNGWCTRLGSMLVPDDPPCHPGPEPSESGDEHE